jgi:CheY-like chemotaxis protein
MKYAAEPGSNAPKVLIADDDPAVVQFLADRCLKMGFEVQTAGNGLQALIMARQGRPDILIVDVNMPEVDGLSLCAHLLDPANRPLEVVVVTGNPSPETIERCEAFGAAYGRKGPDLWNVVRSALIERFPEIASNLAETESSPGEAAMRMRPRVLVVDDDPDVGLFLGSRLRKAGVDALFAPNGIRAYQIALREKPSVILSDYFMPDGDANYLICKLRTTPATASIPVFVMSGRRLEQLTIANLTRKIGDLPGAVRVFKKPFDTNELFLALQDYCALEYRAA